MRIALLGFGLIGGSLARAVRRDSAARELAGTPDIAAWSPTGRGPVRAAAEGIVDRASPTVADAVEGADLVILAGPPLACLDLIASLGAQGSGGPSLASGATVTDVASTKRALIAAADRGGLRYVGGHPMAGRETAGYESATADLFTDRPWIVVPGAHARPIDLERVERLARAAGARPMTMTAPDHDAAVAAISHLPLVLSAALVEAVVGGSTSRPDWAAAGPLAASGWQGMTRLARGDVEMGVGIAATNAAAIAGRLRDLQIVLDAWLVDLDAIAAAEGTSTPDSPGDDRAGSIERLRERLRQAREHLEPRP